MFSVLFTEEKKKRKRNIKERKNTQRHFLLSIISLAAISQAMLCVGCKLGSHAMFCVMTQLLWGWYEYYLETHNVTFVSCVIRKHLIN